MFKKLNLYFFGEEYIHISDFLWFYVAPFCMGILVFAVCLPSWLQMLYL